jgi:His-Xaa-Ser system protein HxsD
MNYKIEFDENVISIESVKKASYKYLNKFTVDLKLDEHKIKVEIEFDSKVAESKHQAVIQDFKKEALDQDLREVIKKETEGYRNLVLAYAFSKTSLISNE